MSTNEVSKSMQKRIDRKKKLQAEKREGLIGAIVGILAIVLIVGGVVFSIVSEALKEPAEIAPNANMGENLNDDGFVKGVTAKDIVVLPEDYASITVPLSEIEYTDEDFEKDKESVLDSLRTVDTETDKHIENGDEINLDYVGSIDGEEFDGGSTNGQGSNLVIGSGSFIPGFEDQIVGHQIGDVFDINVKFPDDYAKAELAGKDAVFNITINGIYVTSEFNDEFVAANLSDVATTVEGYKAYLKEQSENSAKQTYVINYINSNTTMTEYPKKYLRQLKGNQKYEDQQMFDYMKQMYANNGMNVTFEQYMGVDTMETYETLLDEKGKQTEREYLTRQAIAELQGITATDDDIRAYVASLGGEYDTYIDTFGRGFLAQVVIQQKAEDFLVNNAVVK